MKIDRRGTGRRGEEIAADHLRERGYRIVASNYTTRRGEIDLVAEKSGEIVFVEVRFRRSEAHGTPAESVDYRKRRKLIRTALDYLSKHRLGDHPCRFDLIALTAGTDGSTDLLHIENAFDGNGRPTGGWSG